MRATPAITMGIAVALVAFPALAQLGGPSGSSATSDVGGIGGVGGSSFGSSGTGNNDISSPPGAVDPSVMAPVQPTGSPGASGAANTDVAPAGEAGPAINATPVEGPAPPRTGSTAATSTLSGNKAFQSTTDQSEPQIYEVPMPTVEVDLGAIRRVLAAGSSATPRPNGD